MLFFRVSHDNSREEVSSRKSGDGCRTHYQKVVTSKHVSSSWHTPQTSSSLSHIGNDNNTTKEDTDKVSSDPPPLPPSPYTCCYDGIGGSNNNNKAVAVAGIMNILRVEIFGLNPPTNNDVINGKRALFKQVLPNGHRLSDLAVMPGRMEYSLTYGSTNYYYYLFLHLFTPPYYI